MFKKLILIMSVRPLPPELADKARHELNEDPKRLEDGIQHLKEWISKQPHLRARTDDQWLAAFLRGCKHSLELAKDKIDLYYSLRSTAPDLFSIRPNDSKFMELLRSGVALVLPRVQRPTDPRVILIRASEYDPNKFVVSELLALTLVMQQILYLEDDAFLVSGVINIVDMQGATVAHFLQMTPTMMKKMLVTGQDASPVRLKSAHYLSTPPGFESVLCIGKRLMSEKFKSRLYVHNKGFDDLYKFVPREILPEEYGGSGGTVKEITDYWVQKIKEYSDWFADDQMYGTDEHMRAGSPKTPESMFGSDGSFRQLDFD
ncbi:alpha-tocopherol transfer protein-like [Plodia interpunctella]|uniref:alpha-tocopherol transfer protein-like n=1 Tax=Plodia interpunctella TaxID=58824 RepID=UPI0031017088